MSFKSKLKVITTPATRECLGSVIFLHGAGSTGRILRFAGRQTLGEELSFPHLQIHYPTAPLKPYTLSDRSREHVWHDRTSLDIVAKEQLKSIDETADMLKSLIEKEIQSGIHLDKIIFGGFSMGGSMALHMGLRHCRHLRGTFCLSSFLNEDSQVYKDLEGSEGPCPPLFMAHGHEDDQVPIEWGLKTKERLSAAGVQVDFHPIKDLSHDFNRQEIDLFKEWVVKLLPDHA